MIPRISIAFLAHPLFLRAKIATSIVRVGVSPTSVRRVTVSVFLCLCVCNYTGLLCTADKCCLSSASFL